MIRRAKISEIEDIVAITQSCAAFMVLKGIHQWNEHYPNVAVFEADIARGELYVLLHQNIIIGCVVLSEVIDAEYKTVNWLTPNANNLYIHRLAVHPNYQGQGKAQELMSFAEHFAWLKLFSSIRLDTFSQNKRNQKFYETRGYTKLDAIYFPKQSTFPFYCYELVLDRD